MKLLFSTFFDSAYYLNYSKPENKAIFDTKICGPRGLLQLLERLTGNSGNYMTKMQRKLEYHSILSKIDTIGSKFFADSFINDPMGAAGELLRYRDQMVFAGWGPDAPDISSKIDTLRDIEAEFPIPHGLEDRYRILLKEIVKFDSIHDIEEIVVYEKRENMHPFYPELFDLLSSAGARVNYHDFSETIKQTSPLYKLQEILINEEGDKELDIDTNDFQILKFKSEIEAAHFFADQDLSDPGTAIINGDNRVLDSVFSSFGLPCSGSIQHAANTITIQLFKLSASLFTTPLDIYNYMAYLQAPVHPVAAGLRNIFLKEITSADGIDYDLFVQKIEEFDFKDQKDRIHQSSFILPKGSENGNIPIDSLVKFYNAFAAWTMKRVFGQDSLSENVRNQLIQLKALCELLLKALNSVSGPYINQEKFLRFINDVYEPVDVKLNHAEVGSPNLVSGPGQILDKTNKTVWFDFFNNEIKPDWYNFLTGAEARIFDPEGTKLWDSKTQAASVIDSCLRGVLKCGGTLTLVIVEKAAGQSCAEHPFHSILKAKINNLASFILPVSMPNESEVTGWKKVDLVNSEKIALPLKKNIHKIKNGSAIKARRRESYSSTDILINHPIDWVMQYALHIKPGFTYELNEVETTMGNVAHHFINDLFTSCDFNQDRILNRLHLDYETDLQTSIEKFGAILLLDENTFEASRLKDQLVKSVRVLLKIVKENDLRIIGSELKSTEELPGQGGQEYTGDTDLLLETRNRSKVIFDLKWTRKLSRYSDKLKEGKAIQLALYKELVSIDQNSPVEKTAYFLLSDALLLSLYDFSGDHIRKKYDGPDDESVAEMVNNSVKFRMEQLSKGVLEDGEEQISDDIRYCDEEGYDSRISLEIDAGNKQKKNYYSKFKVFKGNYK